MYGRKQIKHHHHHTNNNAPWLVSVSVNYYILCGIRKTFWQVVAAFLINI